MTSLVFDIGGTRTRAGLFDVHARSLIGCAARPTPNHLTRPSASFEELSQSLLDHVVELGREVSTGHPITSVAVGFAGPIDPAGRVLAAPTIWGTSITAPYALGDRLARCWPDASVQVMNDVTAAGYRYLRSAEETFCVVTVSSGIGNKVFVGGRPLVGRSGRGGELGHLQVDSSADAPICECGGRGHLGAVSSGRAALEYAKRRARPLVDAADGGTRDQGSNEEALTNASLAAAFLRGEQWAAEVIQHVTAPLGWALAAMRTGIGVERFVLVGGFALALGEPYRALLAQAAGSCCWGSPNEWDEMLELGFDDDCSGLVGAGIAAALLGGSQ